jgi:hypothetical protein
MSTHDTRHDYPAADRVEGAAILEPAPAAPEPVPTPVPVPVVAVEEVSPPDGAEAEYAEDREPKHAASQPDAEPADRADGHDDAGDASDGEGAWRDLQLRFVDDPKSAVADAADLIEQAVADLRRRLESTDSTEELRAAFLRYREFYQGLR